MSGKRWFRYSLLTTVYAVALKHHTGTCQLAPDGSRALVRGQWAIVGSPCAPPTHGPSSRLLTSASLLTCLQPTTTLPQQWTLPT